MGQTISNIRQWANPGLRGILVPPGGGHRRNTEKKRVRINDEVQVEFVEMWDRSIVTPFLDSLKNMTKEEREEAEKAVALELNEYKKNEMEVHPDSVAYTAWEKIPRTPSPPPAPMMTRRRAASLVLGRLG